jgi:hypothetical protein
MCYALFGLCQHIKALSAKISVDDQTVISGLVWKPGDPTPGRLASVAPTIAAPHRFHMAKGPQGGSRANRQQLSRLARRPRWPTHRPAVVLYLFSGAVVVPPPGVSGLAP